MSTHEWSTNLPQVLSHVATIATIGSVAAACSVVMRAYGLLRAKCAEADKIKAEAEAIRAATRRADNADRQPSALGADRGAADPGTASRRCSHPRALRPSLNPRGHPPAPSGQTAPGSD